MSTFIVGQRYTYPTEEMMLRIANKAKSEGFYVVFGRGILGTYYFEVLGKDSPWYDFEREIRNQKYLFLKTNKFLRDNIVLLGLGGSHAYGTNNENSDIDIRGVATNSKSYILTGRDFEQVVDVETDTTIYSFEKILKLLCSCNPNTIEMLGLRGEDYLYISKYGRLLLENKKMFLSKVAINSFGGYANAQLRRLENKAARVGSQESKEKNILRSIECAMEDIKKRYHPFVDSDIKLYTDKTDRDGYSSEIFMDISLSHYPLRDFKDIWSEMHAITKSYDKLGKRNKNAIDHGKLGKHMCHLVRLFYMCFDILEKGEIVTYRSKEHDLLMAIRNGKYLDSKNQPIPEFYELLNELEKRFDYDKKNTALPDRPDMDSVYSLLEQVNNDICKG